MNFTKKLKINIKEKVRKEIVFCKMKNIIKIIKIQNIAHWLSLKLFYMAI